MRRNTIVFRKCIEPSALLNGQPAHVLEHSTRRCNLALFISYRAQSTLHSTASLNHTHAVASSENFNVDLQHRWRASGSRHTQQQRYYAQNHGSRGGLDEDSTDFLLEHHSGSGKSERTESTRRDQLKGVSHTPRQKNSSENVQQSSRPEISNLVHRRFTPQATRQAGLMRRLDLTRSEPDSVTEEQTTLTKKAEKEEELDTGIAINLSRALIHNREYLPWKKEIQAAREEAIAASKPMTYESQAISPPPARRLERRKINRLWASPEHYNQNLPLEELLNREITAFSEYIRSTKDQIIERWSLARYLIGQLENLRPDWTFEVFGSTAAGLATPESDTDIAAYCKDPTNNRWKLLEDIRDGIKAKPAGLLKEFEVLNLETGKYPLLNLEHLQSGLSIQITSGRKVFPQAFLLKSLQSYPHLRDLYYVIRTMLDIRHLNKVFHGGIGSYTTLMMIIAYLKRRKHDPADTAAQQLLGFLKFYGELDTSKYGISAKTGSLFCKHDFSDREEKVRLHEAAKRRIAKARCNAWLICERDRLVPWRICVQDGVYDGRDVSQKAYAFKHIAHTFRQCYEYLTQFPQLSHSSPLELLIGPSVELYFSSRHSLQIQMKRKNPAWRRMRLRTRYVFSHGQHHHQHVWPDIVKPDPAVEEKRAKHEPVRTDYRSVRLDQTTDPMDSNVDVDEFDMTDEDEQDLTGLEGEDSSAAQFDNGIDFSQHGLHNSLPSDMEEENQQDPTGLKRNENRAVQSDNPIDFSEDALHNLLPPDLAKSDPERKNLEVHDTMIENEKEATPAKLGNIDAKV